MYTTPPSAVRLARHAAARDNAAPSLCGLSAAANASTVALSSGNIRTWTGIFTSSPSRPGAGAIVASFPLWQTVFHTVSMVAQHVHAC